MLHDKFNCRLWGVFMPDTAITKNKIVSFTYTIIDQNGDLFEQSDLPLEYIHEGKNDMFEKVEDALEG